MLVFLFHLAVGVLAGLLFRAPTLLVLAFLVLIGAVIGIASGVSGSVVWWVGAEMGLQFGYVAGLFCRSSLERFAVGVELRADKRL